MSSAAIETFRRSELERRIEELIALLDLLDGDADLEEESALEEDDDLEPSLGWPEQFGLSALAGIREHDDREREDENDEDGGDAEPNGDELDANGDEGGFSGYAEEAPMHDWTGGGVPVAEAMIEANPGAQEKARQYAEAPPLPLVYDFRGT